MTDLTPSIVRFLATLRRRIEAEPGHGPDFLRERDALLSVWPSDDARRGTPATPVRLPACAHFPGALAAALDGPEREIAAALAAIEPALAWVYGYPADPRRPGLADAIAFSDIVGGRGLLRAGAIGIGLTLIAPETAYPSLAHPAVEFYLVLSGTALWTAGAAPEAPRPPGSLILHPESLPHAMTTGSEPLLAVFTWHGDIASPSVYLD
ncbi:dimethylsulfonioproprionate lyase family protein [Segnochrobactrum spirostomi]|uniref:Cupin domain-containing protein n=1 Tax=Segnochrobactrum spirostomi TaxID=2608987 RepID=A0A6A7Y5W4_9HYPH|nr:dimethylsulfonioproprionate lyase family protein [Segnochrobactrum spirostomi]MQT14633.1 hypothetical protein [Segnochrobactrum spirostomi]